MNIDTRLATYSLHGAPKSSVSASTPAELRPTSNAASTTGGGAITNEDRATISADARLLAQTPSDTSDSKGFASIIDAVKENPRLADQMAKDYAFGYDLEVVDLNDLHLEDPSWVASYQKQQDKFSTEMLGYREQRISIYNEMRSRGAGGADIVDAIMAYNRTLPKDYLEKTGLLAAMQ